MNQKRRGFTMVEMIMGLGLIAMLVMIATSFYNTSYKAFKGVDDEFRLQSDFRTAMQFVSHNVSNSSGIFLLKEDEFQPTNLKVGWGYLGIEKVIVQGERVTQIVKYEPQVNAPSTRIKIATSTKEVTYELKFRIVDPLSTVKIIEVTIAGYRNDSNGNKILNIPPIEEMKTTYEATNSLNVSDWGYQTDQAVAIAYQTSDRTIPAAYANVFMVFDISGSMELPLGNTSRLKAAQTAANALVEKLSADNVDIGVGVFDSASINDDYSHITNVNDQYYRRGKKEFFNFVNSKNEKENIKNFINAIAFKGATNTGDGVRVAYHTFKKKVQIDQTNNRDPVKNHFILLVDGDSNAYTGLDPSNTTETEYVYSTLISSSVANIKFYTGSKQTTTGTNVGFNNRPISFGIANHGVTTMDVTREPIYVRGNDINGGEYAKIMSQMIVRNDFVKPYLVECGNGATASGMNYLLDGLGINSNDRNSYFKALDPNSLIASFQNIADSINRYLWFIDGPV